MGENTKLILTILILLLILGIVVVEMIVNFTAIKAIFHFFNETKQLQNDIVGQGGVCDIGGCHIAKCYVNGVTVNCSDIGSYYTGTENHGYYFNEDSDESKCHAMLCLEEKENNCSSIKMGCFSCCLPKTAA